VKPHVIRVVLVDDHALVRSALRTLLKRYPSVRVEGEGANADEAVRLAEAQPDVMLLDLALPGRSGLEAIREVRVTSPWTRILVVSMLDEPSYVRAAFAAGASGYLLKDAADDELGAAILEVAAGGRYMYPPLAARLGRRETQPFERLSGLEKQILELIALGYRHDEMSTMLGVSFSTIDGHRRSLKEKLGVSTRAQLVRYAINCGMLRRDDSSPFPARPARPPQERKTAAA